MTTEIAVGNCLGIALATDSAVTISRGESVKVFNTADKLFELSEIYPIAVMINGNMDCLGLPWEILIKDFREAEGNKPRDTVKQWTDDFIIFVEGHLRISEDAIAAYIEQVTTTQVGYVMAGMTEAVNMFFRSPQTKNSVKRFDPSNALTDVIKTVTDEIVNNYAVAESLVGTSPDDVTLKYSPIIVPTIVNLLPSAPLTEGHIIGLENIVVEALMRVIPSDLGSGIVVAGFGTDDTFPCLHKVEIDGRVLSKLKVSGLQSESIAKSPDGGLVVYFAQTDVIERLLKGVDPRFIDTTAGYINSAAIEVAEAIEKAITGRTPMRRSTARQAVFDQIVESVTKEYRENTAKSLRDKFSRDFDRMVAMMPKQELIELAEALVSITAVERKATSDAGTVGGPIDVAFITKHEGLVWIKRKHYFDGDLNPRYFWRTYGTSPSGRAS